VVHQFALPKLVYNYVFCKGKWQTGQDCTVLFKGKKQQHAISVAGADQSVLIWMNYNHPHMATVSAIFSLVNYYDQATLNPVMVIFL
jgi:hypothetical protein